MAYKLGKPYVLKQITISLDRPIAANQTIQVTVGESRGVNNVELESGGGVVVGTINNTNYPNSERYVVFNDIDFNGVNDLMLSLQWSGTSVLGVQLPITMKGEILDPVDFPLTT